MVLDRKEFVAALAVTVPLLLLQACAGLPDPLSEDGAPLSGTAVAGSPAVTIRAAHLGNPYFPDTLPDAAPKKNTYVVAPAPARAQMLIGERLAVPFSLRSPADVEFGYDIEVSSNEDRSIWIGPVSSYFAWNVFVEGNSNKNCSCPAGTIAQTKVNGDPASLGDLECTASYDPNRPTSSYCNRATYDATQAAVIRQAPFWIKDPLMPTRNNVVRLPANNTELLIVSLVAQASQAPGVYTVALKPRSGAAPLETEIELVNLAFDKPALEVTHWFSWDPRDLSNPQAGDAPIDAWGDPWWSDAHWARIRDLGVKLFEMGNRVVQLPHFVTDNATLNAQPLVPTKCITYDATKSTPLSKLIELPTGVDGSELNRVMKTWTYSFDYSRLQRWVQMFQSIGFGKFDGLPIAGGGKLSIPNMVACDLYASPSDSTPYLKNFYIRRSYTVNGKTEISSSVDDRRSHIYLERYLASYWSQLKPILAALGLDGAQFSTHLIDEPASDTASRSEYSRTVQVFRENLPGFKIREALNSGDLTFFRDLIDVGIINNALLAQDPNTAKVFSGSKTLTYFYNTSAGPELGVSRNLDSTPVDMQAFPLLAAKYTFSGYLYWAVNAFRFPKYAGGQTTDSVPPVSLADLNTFLTGLGRDASWNAYNHTINPNPGGDINPGQGPGAGWIYYPSTSFGLVGSLRAERFYRGVVDHWLYTKARQVSESCQSCLDEVQQIRALVLGPIAGLDTYSINPADYDEARRRLIALILSRR